MNVKERRQARRKKAAIDHVDSFIETSIEVWCKNYVGYSGR